jgi:hypothetical protein
MKKIYMLLAVFLIMVITGCSSKGGDETTPEPLSSAKAITAFSLDGVIGTIDEAAKAIAVTMPFGTNVTNLTPTITHTGASINPTTAQDFSSQVYYTVTAANSSTAIYTVTVAVPLSWSDNFDSYTLGTFPSSGGWILRYNGAGDAYQYIDDTHSVSGQQSMHLEGSSCWSSAMYHPLNLASQVTYEANVFVDAIVSCGCTPSVAVIRLVNPSLGAWGTGFGSVSFNCDGNIYAMQATEPTSNVFLMTYNAQQLYNIKLNINLVARTFDVYVDDVLKGSGYQILDSGNPTGIEVLADHGSSGNPTVWFDDLSVQ